MKKALCIMFSMLIFLGLLINVFAAAEKSEVNSSTAERFALEVRSMIEANEENDKLPGKKSDSQISDNTEFETARLVVKSEHKIDTQNAVSVVNGYDDLWVLQFISSSEAEYAFEYYSTRAGVEYVEADKTVTLSVSSEVNAMSNHSEDEYLSWGPTHIGFDVFNANLIENSTKVTETIIGVVDTGVDPNHPYLDGRVIPTKINTSSSGNRNNSMDDNGHGTQVAGVIADCTADGIYIRPYKVLNNRGQGSVITVAAGINCAVKDGVDVINVSIGFEEDSEVLRAAIQNAEENDIIVVGSAGNDGSDTVYYPSSYSGVIKVSAINSSNVITNFSTFGNDIDFAAPGIDITTTTLNNGYTVVKGTSYAAPFVASVAAAIISLHPDASAEDVKDIMKTNAVIISDFNSKQKYGNGVIHLPLHEDDEHPYGKTAKPEFSLKDAFYSTEIDLEIFCDTENSEIYYTTDRTIPSKNNPNASLYNSIPLHLSETTVIMAVAYCEGYYRSSIASFNAVIAPTVSDSELVVDSNGVLTAYNGSAMSITIPSSVNGITITSIGENAFADSDLTEIIMPKNITSIGKGAFENCLQLKTVAAANVTTIGDRAFYNCQTLRNPYFSELTSIGAYSFYSVCIRQYVLTERTFSLKLEKLTYIPEGAFMNSAISSVKLGNIASIGKNAFSECNALVNVEMDSLTSMPDGAFKGCSSLSTVSIPKLTFIPSGAFSTCENLTNVSIPDATFVNSNAFENCISLLEVNLESAETVFSNAFNGCNSLLTLDLPSMTGFEGSLSSSTRIMLPRNLETFKAPKLTRTVTDMFNNSKNIQNIYLNSATSIAEYTFRGCHNIYFLNIESIKRLDVNSLTFCTIQFIDARSLETAQDMPDNSGILLSNNFIESSDTAKNLTVYGTPGTFVERYSKYKDYNFVPTPLIVNELPQYVTVNSETIYIYAIGFDLTYQWYWNTVNSTDGGTPIKGATSSVYTFTEKDTAPYYYCVITQTDMETVSTIKTHVIIKDTTPADYTAYNEAVAEAKSINRSLYENLYILDELLKIDVSGRFSCEQEIVDAQTEAIKQAIANLKLKKAKSISLYSSETELNGLERTRIIMVVQPVDAIYSDVEWSSDNTDVIIVSQNGYARCIGDGSAVVSAKITNADGSITEGTIDFDCELTTFEKIYCAIFKYIFIIASKTSIF